MQEIETREEPRKKGLLVHSDREKVKRDQASVSQRVQGLDTKIKRDLETERGSTSELLNQFLTHSRILVRDEVDLAKKELRGQLENFRTGAISMAVSAIIWLLALITLCATVVIVLTFYFTLAVAALSVAIALGVVGTLIAFFGLRHIKKFKIDPEKFVH